MGTEQRTEEQWTTLRNTILGLTAVNAIAALLVIFGLDWPASLIAAFPVVTVGVGLWMWLTIIAPRDDDRLHALIVRLGRSRSGP